MAGGRQQWPFRLAALAAFFFLIAFVVTYAGDGEPSWVSLTMAILMAILALMSRPK